MWAEMFEDAQKTRISCSNRIGAGGVDADLFAPSLFIVQRAEAEIRKGMVASYRRNVPDGIQEWATETRGVGVPTLARLLGVIGHPVHAIPHRWVGEGAGRHLVAGEPFDRTPGQLWAYCGWGDATRRRRKGMSVDDALAMGNQRAKKIVWNMAVAQVKSNGAYRSDYDERRLVTADRGWTKGHSHADALRIVAKEILWDLWVAASA